MSFYSTLPKTFADYLLRKTAEFDAEILRDITENDGFVLGGDAYPQCGIVQFWSPYDLVSNTNQFWQQQRYSNRIAWANWAELVGIHDLTKPKK